MLSLTSPEFTLADHSAGQAVNLDAPLPLGYAEAIRMVTFLRKHEAMSWPAIALVMRWYHGWDRSDNYWRKHTRGLVTPRPRACSYEAKS